MKLYGFLSLVAALALAAPFANAQQPGGGAGHQHQRFQQMDRKIDEAGKQRGPARHGSMMEHMQMMGEQMQSMRGMMGSGAGDGPKGPGRVGKNRTGPGQMGSGQMGQMGAGGAQMMQNMQNRMDMMQRMMEQMHKHQELMLKDKG